MIIALSGCGKSSTQTNESNSVANCSGEAGWERATAISPDLVPPCNTGSTGVCPNHGFVYVKGTGWCKPQ
ncbi:hypothetical protein [Acaryochloris sp. CCMEE 5410]|uniref:hypothetical protein n=1 Tax=Acaryochloris sp. CCMEE 5410 TaxID=310037 RepID=UPI001112300B|nr:hypothetical protein [Acaryochloris sp. CCMEE 5410]KAI9129142.1 hypothetical protein ON05_036170 [Acaryochloris sp. CCMEE 5410]